MAQPIIQTAFHAGEWAPALNARVDLAKYHSAAALLENYFVDYRGGASSRAGTKYVLQAYKSATAVRLIPFQASFTVNYVLEFGNFYIRFYANGAPVVEAATTITNISQNDPAEVTDIGHGYNTGDWVFIQNVGGMTQVNTKFFLIVKVDNDHYQLYNLGDSATSSVDSTGYGAYTGGGTAKRVYTLASPYAAGDLSLIKYAQNVNTLVLCHPSYAPYVLTLITATNWTILPISFGATVSSPTGTAVTTTLAGGTVNYSYEVTAVDINGQESPPGAAGALANVQDITTTLGTNTVTWNAVPGAQYYNVYKAQRRVTNAVPAGASYGFCGFAFSTTFIDTNIVPDFSVTPPIVENPFQGAGVASITVTNAGNYNGATAPLVTIAAAPAGGVTATAQAYLSVTNSAIDGGQPNQGWVIGDIQTFAGTGGFTIQVTSANSIFPFAMNSFIVLNPGSLTGGSVAPATVSASGSKVITIDLTWGVTSVAIISGGAGYTSVPGVTFSAGAAAATAALGAASAGNPSVPSYFQQRLVLAGPTGSPQQFNMSQPGSYFNYNISNPIQDDDAIQGTISSLQLNSIKAMVPVSGGLLTLGDRQVFLLNGGGQNVPITPADTNADSQSYSGASDVSPVIAYDNVLYVQAKGAVVRELNFNFYTNTFKGPDISILSSHLFFGYTITGWAYAEEPFKVVWAIRSDGTLLSLTYLKEQELIGWAHSITQGLWKSVCSITETVTQGAVDAVYLVCQRTISGSTVQYIERMADRFWTTTTDPWCVDAGLNYTGVPATVFSGLDHLEGMVVTGIADGVSFGTKTVVAGQITLSSAASNVTIGLSFTPQLQTLQLDSGEPTIQGKPKKITGVTVRCKDTLGLTIGCDSSNQVVMKDTVIGNVGRQTNTVLTGLLTGDAWSLLDPRWQVQGQYLIKQPNPYPVTILGVIPEFEEGNTKR